MTGLEVIQAVRHQGHDYPILVLTARDRWQDKVEGLEAGAGNSSGVQPILWATDPAISPRASSRFALASLSCSASFSCSASTRSLMSLSTQILAGRPR